ALLAQRRLLAPAFAELRLGLGLSCHARALSARRAAASSICRPPVFAPLSSAMVQRIASYAEFWPHYLRAHRDSRTRASHFIGTGLGLGLLAAGAAMRDWRLIVAAPLAGYACAWFAHGVFEGNRPATFGH